MTSIARTAALQVSGVLRMADVSGGVNRFIKRGVHDGVRMEIEDNTVVVNLYLILKPNLNIREVSRNVQIQVARAIQEITGMDVGSIDIYVEGIDYQEGAAGA